MLTNLITNGDFTNGYSEWDVNYPDCIGISTEDYVSSPCSLKHFVPANGYMKDWRKVSIPTGNKVYIRTYLNATSLGVSPSSRIFLQVANYTDTVSLGNVYDMTTVNGGWQRYGRIVTSTDAGIQLSIYTVTNETGSAIYYLDNLVVVDLTTAYGAGLEPRVEWCDANIKFDFDVQGPSLSNLVKNGIFTGNLNDCGWNTGGFTDFLSIDTQNYISSPSSLLSNVITAGSYDMSMKVPAPVEHKLYIGAYINIVSINTNIYLQIADYNDTCQLEILFYKSVVTNGWEHFGAIATTKNGGVQLNIYNRSGTVKYYLDDLVCVDLTEAYGVGSEPTLEWCKSNIMIPFPIITKTGTVSVTNGIQQILTNNKYVNTTDLLSLGAQQSLAYLCTKKSSTSIQNGIITGLSGAKMIYKTASITLGINLTLSNQKSSKYTIILINGLTLTLTREKVSYETISISQGIQQSLVIGKTINVYIAIGINQELSFCRSYISYKCLNAYKNSEIVLTGALNKAIIFSAYTKNY